jgi:SAM-dependent methyltransferase
MSLLPDYSRQARTYDRTRAASPGVLLQLREALAGTQGGRLADIGGGTGNYALALQEHGWEDSIVIDRSPQMLAHARDKGLATLSADAQNLPCPDASFDAATLVSMLHHVEDPAAALAEARRVLRPNGRLAIMVYTREDIEDLWLLDLFPSTLEWMRGTHPTRAELLLLLPGAQWHLFALGDLADASLAALAAHPEKLLDECWRAQTSYFERLGRENPDELSAGLQRLAELLGGGDLPRRPGLASLLAWTKPG